MAVYFIGKSQRDIENISIFAGSETIYGMNENENYSMFSLTDEDKNKPLSKKKETEAIESLRYGMEKFKLFDENAIFVFNDELLMKKVMQKSLPEMKVTNNDIKFIENLEDYNK